MCDDKWTQDFLSSFEVVPLDSGLQYLVELSAFPQAQLEYLAPVRTIFRCEGCSAPVARVKLGCEYRTVNAYKDEVRSIHCTVWQANILREHECSGACQ